MHGSIDVSRGLGQQHGFFHAGVASAIADSACGYAAYTLAPPDTEVLTAEFKINLLAPAKVENSSQRQKLFGEAAA